jgi:hypothetical protein
VRYLKIVAKDLFVILEYLRKRVGSSQEVVPRQLLDGETIGN